MGGRSEAPISPWWGCPRDAQRHLGLGGPSREERSCMTLSPCPALSGDRLPVRPRVPGRCEKGLRLWEQATQEQHSVLLRPCR